MNEQAERGREKWIALRKTSPFRAYGILAMAIGSVGYDKISIPIQSIADAVSEKYDEASNSIKEVKDDLNKRIDEIQSYNIFSDKFNKFDKFAE